MTNRVRNSARPASTWFGGVACSPRALRVRPSTTKILVKLVVSSSRAGATDRAVMARITTMELLGLPFLPCVPPPSSWTFRLGLPVPGVLGAVGRFGSEGPADGAAAGAPAGAAVSVEAGAAATTGAAAGAAAAAGPAPSTPSSAPAAKSEAVTRQRQPVLI